MGDPGRILSNNSESAPLPGIFASWADQRQCPCQHRPAALIAVDRGLPQHTSDHRAATSTSARPGTDSGSFADFLKRVGPRLNRFEHNASADLVAETHRLKVINNRLLFALSFQFVDGVPLRKTIL